MTFLAQANGNNCLLMMTAREYGEDVCRGEGEGEMELYLGVGEGGGVTRGGEMAGEGE